MAFSRDIKSNGFINWPTSGLSSGEGGMWVVAVVDDDYTINDYEHQEKDERPFERCHMDTLPVLPVPDCLQDPDPTAGDPYTKCPRCLMTSRWEYETGVPVNECPVCKAKLTPEEFDKAHFQRFPLQEKHWPYSIDINNPAEYDPEDPRVEASHYSHKYLACVCLGASNTTFLNDDESRFIVTKNDLTPEGKTLVESLETLYGRPVELLTFIDT